MSKNIDDKQIINIIAEIDRLKIIQARHITEGNLEQALEVSNTISDLAKKINSQYIIDEQEDYLSIRTFKKEEELKAQDIALIGNDLLKNFNEMLEIGQIFEAHELVKNFRQKYDSHFNLYRIPSVRECIEKDEMIWKRYLIEQDNKVEMLEDLENQFFKSIKDSDNASANQIIEKAWDYIYKLEGPKKDIYLNKWGTLEHNLIQGLKYEEYERIQKIKKRVEKIIKDSKSLEETLQFDKAITLLTTELNSTQINEFLELKMELKIRLSDSQTSKTLFENTYNNIEHLKIQFKQCLKQERLEEAVNHCEEIIKIAENHKINEITEEHEILLKDLKSEIAKKELKKEEKKKFDILKEKVLILNKQGLESLDNNEIIKALDKYKTIKTLISDHVKQ